MGAGGQFVTRVASTIVELFGIAAITWGFVQIAPWLGWIVGGLALVLIGFAIDPPRGADR